MKKTASWLSGLGRAPAKTLPAIWCRRIEQALAMCEESLDSRHVDRVKI
jgi:hypothetical protein